MLSILHIARVLCRSSSCPAAAFVSLNRAKRNHKERLRQTRKTREHDPLKRWQEPTFNQSMLLVHDGSRANPDCYARGKASTIPTAGGSMPHTKLACPPTGSMAATVRPNLVFFAGKASAGVRSTIQSLILKHNLSTFGTTHFEYPDYVCAMRASEFCMAPRGNAAWSPRLEESIANGCIPVIVADKYDPPFVHILNYSSFSVQIKQNNIGSLQRVLGNLTRADRDALRANGQRVRHLFSYNESGVDASALVAFEMWARLNGHMQDVDRSSATHSHASS